jgi:glycosyltransferase involved in cell wall biosynthesis
MDSDTLANLYRQASLLFWPGVNEAFGLTYLEAQAAGVPVVAQNRPGVCDVTHGTHPRPHEGTMPLVAAITALLSNQTYAKPAQVKPANLCAKIIYVAQRPKPSTQF